MPPGGNNEHTGKSLSGGAGLHNATAAPGAGMQQGVHYIIAVGVDEYDREDLRLESCVNDCKEFISILHAQYKDFKVYKTLLNKEATREAIITCINEFSDSPANTPLNDLIIFFSGHGDFVETPERKVGSFIPSDYANDPRRQFLRFDTLLDELEYIKTRHLLVIVDSCFSGELYKHHNVFESSDGGAETRSLYEEPSRWCLTSSRGNQKSAAGKNLSAFTEALLDILDQNQENLQFLSLAAALRERFSEDKLQRVDFGRLQIAKNNAGEFRFESLPDESAVKKRKEILADSLLSLNYKEQEQLFGHISDSIKKQLAIFSGTSNCGLHFLSQRARRESPMKDNFITPKRASAVSAAGEGIQKVLNLFNLALNTRYPDIDALSNGLLTLLRNQTLIFEFFFYYDAGDASGEMQLRPEDKKKMLDQIGSFIQKINNTSANDYKLLVLIIDQECCDYATLYGNQPVAGVETVFMPLIKPVALDEATKWYQDMRRPFTKSPQGIEAFDGLFKKLVQEKLQQIITDTSGYPGSVLKAICREAQCEKLAVDLLNPKS